MIALLAPPRRLAAKAATLAILAAGLALQACGDGQRRDRATARPPVPASAPPQTSAASSAASAVTGPASPAPTGGTSAGANAPLLIPVAGVQFAMLRDDFNDVRGTGRHEALDIMAPRGTPVHAVADGRVAKLFTSVPGGLTVYQFDSTGSVAYYYAHLDSYADGLREGLELKRGDPIGTVGSTSNAAADAPHLHFAVNVLGPQREWWKGTPVNPYPLFAPQR
ncbi:MAG TPA: M23 family metallopeptidase [Rubrivivax sp.]|nr:M23 family metallopeptidase [Rubrivivax sp.]